jgi:hypothetical protein
MSRSTRGALKRIRTAVVRTPGLNWLHAANLTECTPAAAVFVTEARRRGQTDDRVAYVVGGALLGGAVFMRMGTWLQHVDLSRNASPVEQWLSGNTTCSRRPWQPGWRSGDRASRGGTRSGPYDPLRLCVFATIALLGWLLGPYGSRSRSALTRRPDG